MKSNFTYILAITDRSGSMEDIMSDMEKGFNHFVKEQAELPGECKLMHVQFDNAFQDELVYNGPIADAPAWVLAPRGSTALWDAQGKAISELGRTLASLPEEERPEKVVVVTVTDGLENSSKTWTSEKVASLIKEQTEKWNWQFIYLGANQDAINEGEKMGVNAANSMTYAASSAGITNTFQSVSASVGNYRGGLTSSTSFSQVDREAAMSGNEAPQSQ